MTASHSLRTPARAVIAVIAAAVLTATLLIASPTLANAVSLVDRLDGPDRYSASVAMSQAMPTTGRTIFLASGEKFPDALAAAPVVAAERAHMLLTPGRDIPPVVATEIRRIAPSNIVLVGSTATLSEAVRAEAAALAPGARIERINGVDRVHVSMLLLDRLRTTLPAADVWVASGLKFPDALAAGAVAARNGHALILTVGANATFREQLQARLGPTARYYIAGAEVTVGDDVRAMLEATGRPVSRYAGADRYATAIAINQAFTTSSSDGSILLASGAMFPDALGGAVLAGVTGRPLYLTYPPCAASDAVLHEAGRIGAMGVIALGGPPTVSRDAALLRSCSVMPAIGSIDSAMDAHRATLTGPVAPLQRQACLDAMAQAWANEMAARQLVLAHNPDLQAESRTCGMRSWSENVGRTWGQDAPSADRIMQAWLDSPGHRANIERVSSEHVGIGIAHAAKGDWYYVVNFGTD